MIFENSFLFIKKKTDQFILTQIFIIEKFLYTEMVI